MKTKEINVGNITGLSTYQLAVLSGKFTGSLEDFLNKEQQYYDDTVSYVDEAKAKIEEMLASIIDSDTSGDLSEIINARGQYKLLGERLNATDTELQVILERLNQLDPDEINIDAIKVLGANRNVELRNNGVVVQWRQIGETKWNDLIMMDEITPNIQIGKVAVTSDPNKVKASISGTRKNPLLNFTLPKGKDGVDGGSILDFSINEDGEGIVTVLNKNDDEFDITDEEGNHYLIPVLSIGNVETLEHDQEATVTLSGTLTNPVLNFGIPRGKPSVVKRAKIGPDGWLEFEIE